MKYKVESKFFDSGRVEIKVDYASKGDVKKDGGSDETCDVYIDIMNVHELVGFVESGECDSLVNNTSIALRI